MRISTLLVPAALMVIPACGPQQEPVQDNTAESLQLTTVTCADAQGLTLRAGEARGQQSARAQGDLARIIATNRATYFGALLTVAQLKCGVTDVQAEGALAMAFDAVRAAQRTSSDYERARKWGEAAQYTTQAIGYLIKSGKSPASGSVR